MSAADIAVILFIVAFAVCGVAGAVSFLLAIVLPALDRYKVATAGKLMNCSRICVLAMCCLFALAAMLVGHYPIGMMLLAAIILGLIRAKSKINACPLCDELIGLERQWSHFTKWFFRRRSSLCPNCKANLVRAKWPWRATHAGILLGLACIVLRLLNILPTVALPLTLWPASILIVLGTSTSKFEVAP